MPQSCVAVNCTQRCSKSSGVSFHKFPADSDRRRRWIISVDRKKWSPRADDRLCGKHFLEGKCGFHINLRPEACLCAGKPSLDPDHPDFVPTVFAHKAPVKRSSVARYARATKRKIGDRTNEALPLVVPCIHEDPQSVDPGGSAETGNEDQSPLAPGTCPGDAHCDTLSGEGACDEVASHSTPPAPQHTSTQTNLLVPVPCYICEPQFKAVQKRVQNLEAEVLRLQKDVDILKAKPAEPVVPPTKPGQETGTVPFSARQLGHLSVTFYTGLPNLPTFFFIVALLEGAQAYVPKGSTLGDVVLIVLMKLRLALLNVDLGYRFGLSETTIGKIMKVNIPVLSSQLKRFIIWPTKDDTSRTLPTLVRRRYPDCRAIIDCTECRIERPLAFGARSETYSHYKGTNTVKFLIGITPNGAVSFVSKCWGGRASDKKLIQSSGFLDKLADGDVILADRGFLIKEDVARRGARLVVPALTRGKKQLPAREAEEARQISRIRIHVERAIGRMKVYRILRDRLPVSLLRYATSVVNICAALTNMRPRLT